ncbi:MAG: hypothetical protein SFY67_12215 [Candidatus Melainabacteria bacterium]|nr:hypothetical protein [Candidatus Melainabacteria bacterium]
MSFGLRPIPWTVKNLLAIWLISLASSPAFAQVQPPEITSSVYCDLHRELPVQLATATISGTTSSPTDTMSTSKMSADEFAKSETTLLNSTPQAETKPVQNSVLSSKSELIPISPGQSSASADSSISSDLGSTSDSNESVSMEPINLAQSVPTDVTNENQQVDLVPTNIPRRTPAFNRMSEHQIRLYQTLPRKLFFSSVLENSLRLETNVFQTSPKESSDMIYRVLPNTTIGYEIAKNTQIYSNYFFLRDQYTDFSPLLNRNFHSIGFGLNRTFELPKQRGSLILGLLGRGLFATLDKFPGSFFNDYLPSITYQRAFNRGDHSHYIYASVFGQLRFREMAARFQEGDIFYTAGHIYRHRGWAFLNNITLASNFGSQKIRQGPDTQIIILEHELSRQISRRFSWLQTFIRAQEIFNMGAGNVPFTPGAVDNAVYPGFSGVNCRVFAGIRATVFKAALPEVKLKGQ